MSNSSIQCLNVPTFLCGILVSFLDQKEPGRLGAEREGDEADESRNGIEGEQEGPRVPSACNVTTCVKIWF